MSWNHIFSKRGPVVGRACIGLKGYFQLWRYKPDTMNSFFVVPRVQRERASGVHLALLARRDLLALAMRGARVPPGLQDLQDLPPSLALTDRVRMWSVGLGP